MFYGDAFVTNEIPNASVIKAGEVEIITSKEFYKELSSGNII